MAANRIAELRGQHNLSLRKLSLALDPTGDLGPTERSIWRWETGEGGVPDKHKFALAELFGVSVAYLMGWDDQPTRPDEQKAAA